ncbi:MAG TPA: hypothetical protein DHW02_00065, partial [Ktedonobacter sp.]|nr:hypothetical protein [Ktedonobacter sp.]
MQTSTRDTRKPHVHDAMPTGTAQKALYIGTHRVCPPEETFSRVEPFFSTMGITRVADITHLDDLGIPVF